MAELIDTGTWVEICRVVLSAHQRAPQVPADTQRVPLEMRLKGVLLEPASPGDEVTIVTAAGRRLRGTLVQAKPPYSHGFGVPIEELANIGAELRDLLRKRGRAR